MTKKGGKTPQQIAIWISKADAINCGRMRCSVCKLSLYSVLNHSDTIDISARPITGECNVTATLLACLFAGRLLFYPFMDCYSYPAHPYNQCY